MYQALFYQTQRHEKQQLSEIILNRSKPMEHVEQKEEI